MVKEHSELTANIKYQQISKYSILYLVEYSCSWAAAVRLFTFLSESEQLLDFKNTTQPLTFATMAFESGDFLFFLQ